MAAAYFGARGGRVASDFGPRPALHPDRLHWRGARRPHGRQRAERQRPAAGFSGGPTGGWSPSRIFKAIGNPRSMAAAVLASMTSLLICTRQRTYALGPCRRRRRPLYFTPDAIGTLALRICRQAAIACCKAGNARAMAGSATATRSWPERTGRSITSCAGGRRVGRLVAAGPGESFSGPEPATGDGQYHVVVRGTVIHDDRTRESCPVALSAADPAPVYRAGVDGAALGDLSISRLEDRRYDRQPLPICFRRSALAPAPCATGSAYRRR